MVLKVHTIKLYGNNERGESFCVCMVDCLFELFTTLNNLSWEENAGKLLEIGIMLISLAMVLGFFDPVYICNYK